MEPEDIPEMVTGEPREAKRGGASASGMEADGNLPVRFQQPSYFIKQMGSTVDDNDNLVPVGADISTTTGPVPLSDIIKRLAALKNMNVSWASDVNQYIMTDVDIRADDDFFQAIDNLLRQVDYYHEVEGNTIIVKFKETRKFHIAMPPRLTSIASSNNTSNSTSTALSDGAKANPWDDIRVNLDQILDIWSETPVATSAPEEGPVVADSAESETSETARAPVRPERPSGKGYYTINEPIGLITVTAPQQLLRKISEYIESIKFEVYRQISIEAKIVEVELSENATTGINWSDLLSAKDITFSLFDGTGVIKPRNNTSFIDQISIDATFDLVLDAMATVGTTRVLSNPKISVMNGQPAVIYAGDNITYIDKVTTTVDEGVVSTSVTTAQATSGVRLEVFPTIINEEEIILSLTPMISGLQGDTIQYVSFGDNTVGIPVIKERTMNSIVRVRDGQMLVIGGMIIRSDLDNDNKVQLLGDLPVIKGLFKSNQKIYTNKEVVVLLRPRII